MKTKESMIRELSSFPKTRYKNYIKQERNIGSILITEDTTRKETDIMKL